MILALVMVMGMCPMSAMAADGITVYVTVSNQGVLATDKLGDAMAHCELDVTDHDGDGTLSVSDALIAAHTQLSENGAADYGLAYGYANKLWGISTSNLLAFVNDKGFSTSWDGKSIAEGDHIVASVNADNATYADWYTYFDVTDKEVMAGEDVTLTLKGFQGMMGGTSKAVAGVAVGIWKDGVFSAIEGKMTDADGKVSICFDEPGKYYVTASGTVRDTVTDWGSGTSFEKDCPIIAPVCAVSVRRPTQAEEQAKIVADDLAALRVDYDGGTSIALAKTGTSGESTITWKSEPAVVSADGVVTKSLSEQKVTLSATVKYGEASDSKSFVITVPALTIEERLHSAKAALCAETLTPVEFTNASEYGYKYDSKTKDTNVLDMAKTLIEDFGVTAELSAAVDGIISKTGAITYPTEGAKEATLSFVLKADSQSDTHDVTILVPKHAQTKTEAIAAMMQVVQDAMGKEKVLNGNISLDAVKTALLLPGGKTSGLYITWKSSNEDVIESPKGNPSSTSSHPTGGKYEVKINRPNVGQSDATVTLTATFVYKTTSTMCAAGEMPTSGNTMEFTVKVPAVTEDEMQAIVDAADADIKLGSKTGAAADLSAITSDLYFPAYEGYTTTWSTDLPIAIPSKGYDKSVITRPTDGKDKTGTVTLTITKGETSKTKTFPATVKAWTEAELDVYRDELKTIASSLSFDTIKKKNTDANAVSTDLDLKQCAKISGTNVTFNTYNSGSYPYSITWSFDPAGVVSFSNGTGKISQTDFDRSVTLTATVNLKTPIETVSSVKKTIAVTVIGKARAVLDAIAEKYAESGVAADANGAWLAADLAAYDKAFGTSTLDAEQKQAMVDVAIEKLSAASAPGDAAKYIISLVSLGYDPRKLTTAKLEKLNAMQTFDSICFDAEGNVTPSAKNQYTLSYVLIAYEQFGTAYQTQIDKLIAAAVETKSAWLTTTWGPDAAAPMVLALAPYANRTTVKNAIDEAIAVITSTQKENGSMYNSASSTGLSLAAYAAVGINPATVKHSVSGKNAVEGLMAYVSSSKDGFKPTSNSFGTEQGLRGLIAVYAKQADEAYLLYDFSGQKLIPAEATPSWAENCAVRFDLTPANANVEVKKDGTVQTAYKAGCYDLAEGEYTYLVTCKGYAEKEGTFTVTQEDVQAGTMCIEVKLSRVSGGADAETITVSISVVNPKGGYFIAKRTLHVEAGMTAAELLLDVGLDVVCVNNPQYGFYVESINGVGEFDEGSGSGWMYKVNSEFPEYSAEQYVLSEGDFVQWVYTRDIGEDVGNKFRGSSDSDEEDENAEESELGFADVDTDDYFYDAVAWAKENGITSGTSTKKFSPDALCTRAQMITFLWRAAGCPEAKTDEHTFLDVADDAYYMQALLWAVETGITGGTSKTTFSPDLACTRAQMAAMLYRLAKMPTVAKTKTFADVANDAYYADAVIWAKNQGIAAGTSKTTFSPDAPCTRAQMVTFLYRYLTK